MNPAASLKDLMDYMEAFLNIDGFRAYFDRQTGRIVAVEKSVLKAVKKGRTVSADKVDPDEIETAEEIIKDKTGRFIQPPNKSLFNEHRCKKEFINTIPDPRIAKKLARALRGPRGISRLFWGNTTFASVLYKFYLEEQWYKYLANAQKQFLIQWAKENNLPYEDDLREEGSPILS
jgi:hypothetical protein